MRISYEIAIFSVIVCVGACTGERLRQVYTPPPCVPQEQVCNGQDNDCDGKPDTFWAPCSTACGKGMQFCGSDGWQACSAPVPQPETCNGIDDDCNGLVDDGVTLGFCYDGSAESLKHGQCHPGIERCVAGLVECENQQLPMPEVCNGLDDDCNGAIDDGFGQDLDLVLVLDYSGSMRNTVDGVTMAVEQWAVKYPSYKFGLIAAPRWDIDQSVDLITNLTPPGFFVASMPHPLALETGLEPTLDALSSAIINDPIRLNVFWRNGAKHAVIIFSDEVPQSYANPVVTVAQVQALYTATGTALFVFGDPGFPVPANRVYPLGSDYGQKLDDIIAGVVCR